MVDRILCGSIVAVVICALPFPAAAQGCPGFVGSIGIDTQWAWGITASDGYAFVGTASGLRVFDVTKPSVPVEVGSLDIPGGAGVQAVSGNHVYLTSSHSIRVIDVSVPSAPVEVWFFDLAPSSSPSGIAVEGSFAYLAIWNDEGFGALVVFDVSTPSAPIQVGGWGWQGGAVDIAVSGDFVYVTGIWFPGGWGLSVIDVATPSSPVEVGFCEVPEANRVALSGSHAYVVPLPFSAHHSLTVIDVSIPAQPIEVGLHEFGALGNPTDVAVSGHHAYVPVYEQSQDDSSLRVMNVGMPSAPVEVGFADTTGEPSGVAVSAGHVYAIFVDATDSRLDVFLECGVFTDSFESGDTSAWSATVP